MMMTASELAAELHVSRQQVHAWYMRRARNGFPEPVRRAQWGGGYRPLWDLSEVTAWRRDYEPSRGGRPAAAKVV
jgi:hypothetical protein